MILLFFIFISGTAIMYFDRDEKENFFIGAMFVIVSFLTFFFCNFTMNIDYNRLTRDLEIVELVYKQTDVEDIAEVITNNELVKKKMKKVEEKYDRNFSHMFYFKKDKAKYERLIKELESYYIYY